MGKIEYEYEIWLMTTKKWNICVKLTITSWKMKKNLYGLPAFMHVIKSKFLYSEEDVKNITDLKEMTDEFYLKSHPAVVKNVIVKPYIKKPIKLKSRISKDIKNK